MIEIDDKELNSIFDLIYSCNYDNIKLAYIILKGFGYINTKLIKNKWELYLSNKAQHCNLDFDISVKLQNIYFSQDKLLTNPTAIKYYKDNTGLDFERIHDSRIQVLYKNIRLKINIFYNRISYSLNDFNYDYNISVKQNINQANELLSKLNENVFEDYKKIIDEEKILMNEIAEFKKLFYFATLPFTKIKLLALIKRGLPLTFNDGYSTTIKSMSKDGKYLAIDSKSSKKSFKKRDIDLFINANIELIQKF